jgi:hypothetical protein
MSERKFTCGLCSEPMHYDFPGAWIHSNDEAGDQDHPQCEGERAFEVCSSGVIWFGDDVRGFPCVSPERRDQIAAFVAGLGDHDLANELLALPTEEGDVGVVALVSASVSWIHVPDEDESDETDADVETLRAALRLAPREALATALEIPLADVDARIRAAHTAIDTMLDD